MPLAVVTCGPAFAPIDDVRCITNHSTGELGAILSNTLAAHGLDVACLRGRLATYPVPNVPVTPFGTNDELEDALISLPQPIAIFHAAALCDFNVEPSSSRKISSAGETTLVLKPAKKLIAELRSQFPSPFIVGWKFEADGNTDSAIARAQSQIDSCRTSACVVNGPAYGPGFGFLEHGRLTHLADKPTLCEFLADWTVNRL